MEKDQHLKGRAKLPRSTTKEQFNWAKIGENVRLKATFVEDHKQNISDPCMKL